MDNKNKVGKNKENLKINIKKQIPKTNERGITIVGLVITIIVMLILIGVSVNIGENSIDNSKLVDFLLYMQTIQGKVDFIAEHENYSNYGKDLTGNQINTLNSILNNGNEIYVTTISSTHLKYFDKELLSSELNIENIDDEIVIDFNTRELISLNGIKYEDEMYYSQYFLPGGQTIKQTETLERDLSMGNIEPTIDGLNATLTITDIKITNGTLSYGKMDAANVINWITITNYTKKGGSITTKNITESGTYYFRLVDNVTGEDNGIINGEENITYPSIELSLTNSPKLEGDLTNLSTSYNYSDLSKSENWAFATDSVNGKKYVWIPRFAYETENQANIEFLRGTSDITTSGSYINSTEWTVPDEFTEGNIPQTGVWVQVSSLNQTRNKYNEHINKRNNIVN